ncbi:hypothetical protein [Aquitalea palustris]
MASATAAAQVYICIDQQTGRPSYSNYPDCTMISVGKQYLTKERVRNCV